MWAIVFSKCQRTHILVISATEISCKNKSHNSIVHFTRKQFLLLVLNLLLTSLNTELTLILQEIMDKHCLMIFTLLFMILQLSIVTFRAFPFPSWRIVIYLNFIAKQKGKERDKVSTSGSLWIYLWLKHFRRGCQLEQET